MKQITFSTAFATYRAVGILGQGGSGMVYEVTDETGLRYAVKCLDPHRATSEKRKRFKNEILFGVKNAHKNIVTVLDHGLAQIGGQSFPFYVMRCYPSTLRRLINAGIAPGKVLPYFAQILDGVEAAHLISAYHRDLKPENILHDPDSDVLAVADFGIAHFSEEYLQALVETTPRELLANFQYAAPEQRRAGQPVDPRTDIYALGLILNEMFTTQVIQGTQYKTIASAAPDFAYLDGLVDAMVRQMPEDRPATIDEVKKSLIVYQNEFISRQRLSDLTKTVVAQSELDDPLLAEPPSVVDLDYRQGWLHFRPSQPLTRDWITTFKNIHVRSAPSNLTPSAYELRKDAVRVKVPEAQAQLAIDQFREYVRLTTADYEELLRQSRLADEQEERTRLQEQIREEEARQRVLSTVRL